MERGSINLADEGEGGSEGRKGRCYVNGVKYQYPSHGVAVHAEE